MSESRESAINDLKNNDIKHKLNEINEAFLNNPQLDDTQKRQFIREWLGVQVDVIDENNNGLIDKFIQERIRKYSEKQLEVETIREKIIFQLNEVKKIVEKRDINALNTVTDALKEKFSFSKTSTTPEVSTAETPTTQAEPKTSTTETNPVQNDFVQAEVIQLWVKKNLEGYFADINQPTKNEIIAVLDSFKDTIFNKKQSSPEGGSRAMYAIQAGIKLFLSSELKVDGVYGNKTKNAIRDFQINYNQGKDKTSQIKVDGIPGSQTIKALLEKLN